MENLNLIVKIKIRTVIKVIAVVRIMIILNRDTVIIMIIMMIKTIVKIIIFF